MSFTVEEVLSEKQKRAFLDVPHRIYAKDPVWVCPLDQEVEAVFNPDKNPFFGHGEATRWLLKDSTGTLVGRVAAFINHKKATNFDVPTGGMGFFECIEDQTAAYTLFDTCKQWLMSRGMEAMDGPINFGENDKFWGLLVYGFTHPAYGMTYNPPYYQAFFESYGFTTFFEQVSNHLNITRPMPERFLKIAQWIADKPGVHYESIKKDNLMKYGLDFMNVYNDAWRFHENFTEMTENQIKVLISELKPVIIEEMIWFAYVENDPAAFMICLPDVNQIIKPLKGKLGLSEKILFWWRSRNKFKWYRDRKLLTRGRVTILGVKPEYQKYGLESGLIMFPMEKVRGLGFEEIELSWVGDFNPKMRKLHENTGATLGKLHKTYRVLFDPVKQAERSRIIAMDTREKAAKEKYGEAENPEA
jgi:hypothetical protein